MNVRLVVMSLGVLVTVVLPLSFPRDGGPTGFDRAVMSWDRSTFRSSGLPRALLESSQLHTLLPLILIGALYFGLRAQSARRVVVLVIAPVLAVALTETALKPMFGRHLHSEYVNHTFLDYPSGNTVALTSVATAFAVVVTARWARATVIGLGALAMAGVGIGLVWFHYHYATDVIGGICFAIAVVMAVDAVVMLVENRQLGSKRNEMLLMQ